MADLPIYSPLPGGNRAHGPLTSPDIQGMHPESALGFTVPQAAPESFGFWDHAGDIAAAVPRGLAGGLEGLLEIPSDLGGVFTDSGQLYDVPDNFGLGRSKTLVGGLTEGVSQFLIPSKLANMAAKGVKVGAKGIEGLKNIKYLGRYKKSSKLIKTDKKLIKQYGRGKSREVRRALQSKEELEFYRDAAKTAGWGNDQIKAMAGNGGVIGVNYEITFVGEEYRVSKNTLDAEKAEEVKKAEKDFAVESDGLKNAMKDIDDRYSGKVAELKKPHYMEIVDHIDHMVSVAGIEHVGLGSDFDGATMPEGMEDCTKVPYITDELVKRGYSEGDIRKILGENFMRVMEEVLAD